MLQSHKNIYVSIMLIQLFNDRYNCMLLGSGNYTVPETEETLSIYIIVKRERTVVKGQVCE